MHRDMFDVGLWVIWQTGSSTDCGEKISPPSVWTLRKTESMLGLDDPGYILASTSDASAAQLPPTPPTADAFKQHVLREMYQTATRRHSHLPEALSSRSPFGKRKKKKKKKGLDGHIDVEKETICSTRPQRLQGPVVQLRDLRRSRN